MQNQDHVTAHIPFEINAIEIEMPASSSLHVDNDHPALGKHGELRLVRACQVATPAPDVGVHVTAAILCAVYTSSGSPFRNGRWNSDFFFHAQQH